MYSCSLCVSLFLQLEITICSADVQDDSVAHHTGHGRSEPDWDFEDAGRARNPDQEIGQVCDKHHQKVHDRVSDEDTNYVSPRMKQAAMGSECLASTEERQPAQETLESQNGNPERKEIVGDPIWHTKVQQMRIRYSYSREDNSHDCGGRCGRQNETGDHEDQNFFVIEIQCVETHL